MRIAQGIGVDGLRRMYPRGCKPSDWMAVLKGPTGEEMRGPVVDLSSYHSHTMVLKEGRDVQ